jgi:hypothetical protein
MFIRTFRGRGPPTTPSALSISFGTSAVPMGFGLRVKTLTLFGFDALEEVEPATFLTPCLQTGK